MQDNVRSEPAFIRAKRAAEILDIDVETLYRMLNSGIGPPFTRLGKGRIFRIPYDKFKAWLASQTKG